MVASVFDPELLYGQVAEILPDRLFFASLKDTPRVDPTIRYVRVDEKVHYEPFYTDFGPLNLSVLYRFCEFIHSLLDTSKHKRRIFIYTSVDEKCRVNAAYIMGAYLVIYHRVSADSAYLRVKVAEPPFFIGFRDASLGEPTYLLHLHDVLRGVEKAMSLKWLDFKHFDAEEYEYYERVENGDLNWIIPGKVLSFCGPHNESRIEDGYPYHSPETYFPYFRKNNVSTIIRLNMKMYDAEKFRRAGFDHVDLFFIDGSTPSEEIVLKFIDVVDRAKGAVAVHCKAGLGRTGTLIACWMMKEYGLTAAECMAWLRICRPGSVIGPQQEFLVTMQKFCWSRSVAVHMAKKKRAEIADSSTICSFRGLTSKVDDIRLSPKNRLGMIENSKARPNILPIRRTKRTSGCEIGLVDETELDEKGRSQGDRLLAMKARSQHAAGSSSTSSPNGNIPATYRTYETPRTPSKSERNGNLVYHQAMNTHAARSSAASHFSSRFSSPTTPIKQPSPVISSPTSHRSHLVLRNQPIPVPTTNVVSRVTVAPASKATPVRLSTSSKSTSALRKVSGVRTRTLPYPSTGTRVEMAPTPSTGYELRSRTALSSTPLSAAALALPPNSEALIGSRRKKRST